MLTELAHYFFIFATAVFCLETLILAPSVWQKASAVAIKLGFRGFCFGGGLLFLSFCLLVRAYAVKDFSVAAVFETASAAQSNGLIPAALLSSREGLFFVLILLVFAAFARAYRQRRLPYVERGRFLFSGACVLSFLLILCSFTAFPFVRIADPALEGIAVNPLWTAPYLSVKTLASLCALALLLAAYLKFVCLSTKGAAAGTDALADAVGAAGLMLLSCALGACAGFLGLDVPSVAVWEASETLLAGALLLTIAFALCLYANVKTKTFSLWAIAFGAAACTAICAVFFAREYSLFALKLNKAYFPNPVIAVCAAASVFSLLSFFVFSFVRKMPAENGFAVLSRETFVGFAAAVCAVSGAELAVYSFLPVAMLFAPAALWRDFPDYFTAHTFVYLYLFALFAAAAACVGFTDGRPRKRRKKLLLCFGAGFAALFGLASLILKEKTPSALAWTLPSGVVCAAVLNALNFKIAPVPVSARGVYDRLSRIKAPSYAAFFLAAGFLICSFSFAAAKAGMVESVFTPDASEPFIVEGAAVSFNKNVKPASAGVRLTDAATGAPEKVEIVGLAVSGGDGAQTVFHGVLTRPFKTVVVKVRASSDSEPACFVTVYPFLRLMYAGFFMMAAGVILLYAHLKRSAVK